MCHDFFLGLVTKFCSSERASGICANVDLNLPAIAEKLAFLFCVYVFFFLSITDSPMLIMLISRVFFPKPVSVLIYSSSILLLNCFYFP